MVVLPQFSYRDSLIYFLVVFAALSGDSEKRSDFLVWIVLAVLIVLVIVNTLLFYKLWLLEDWAKSSRNTLSRLDFEVGDNS